LLSRRYQITIKQRAPRVPRRGDVGASTKAAAGATREWPEAGDAARISQVGDDETGHPGVAGIAPSTRAPALSRHQGQVGLDDEITGEVERVWIVNQSAAANRTGEIKCRGYRPSRAGTNPLRYSVDHVV
jgi:hypothetical protein